MSDQHSGQAPHLSCGECVGQLQDYLDDGRERGGSMAVYLHLRACPDCAARFAELESLVSRLEQLPEREVPADFDARVLAQVPYENYRAMAALRAPRVPVFLERESMPVWLRHPVVRGAGLTLALLAVAARLTVLPIDGLLLVAALGAAPEFLVQLQALARTLTRAAGSVREGA